MHRLKRSRRLELLRRLLATNCGWTAPNPQIDRIRDVMCAAVAHDYLYATGVPASRCSVSVSDVRLTEGCATTRQVLAGLIMKLAAPVCFIRITQDIGSGTIGGGLGK